MSTENEQFNMRENIIKKYFDMWINQTDEGFDSIFDENAVYIESWGPKYIGRAKIHHWFNEWNTRGKVQIWDIQQFFHKENETVVEWYFKCLMNDGKVDEFNGMSLIKWNNENLMIYLQEFGCNIQNYDPYEKSDTPQFQDQKINWF